MVAFLQHSNSEHSHPEKTSAQLLKRSEASLQAIIENAGMTIYSLDREFRYIHFNTLLKEMLKVVYDVDIRVGDVVFDFLYRDSPEEANEWRRTYTRALTGEPLQFVKEFKIGTHHVFLKFYVNPIREGMAVTGLSCVAIDISKERIAELERNKMANELYKRNQNLEQYAYIISHNLRAPIANLLGIANLLEIPGVSVNDKERAMQHVLTSARRLNDVVTDLSDILQKSEEINIHRESVLFQNVVNEVTTSMREIVAKKEAMIITNFLLRPGIITIKTYLHSIFYNLISNSIKFSKPGIPPVIRINSKQKDGRTCITFEDNGLGLDLDAYRDKLFGLYQRFHPQAAEGKGMGLFMVRNHVEALGGSITIDSEDGRGTILTIVL